MLDGPCTMVGAHVTLGELVSQLIAFQEQHGKDVEVQVYCDENSALYSVDIVYALVSIRASAPGAIDIVIGV